ncbi:MAG: preprotein translocase subunit SecE [Deltaproteobacteria bacterium]|nr:preprotein translocase subunit SecE [Deltaproteobacteria bacterium]
MNIPNYQRWVSLGLLGAAALVYAVVGKLAETVWDLLRLPLPEWPLAPTDLIALVAAIACFLLARRHARLNSFLNDAVSELSKVSWPPRKETMMSAGVITVVVGICSLFLALYDVVWGWCVKLVY